MRKYLKKLNSDQQDTRKRTTPAALYGFGSLLRLLPPFASNRELTVRHCGSLTSGRCAIAVAATDDVEADPDMVNRVGLDLCSG